MMKWILTILILSALVFGGLNNQIEKVNIAAIKECSKAIELTLSLAGTVCLWSGLMQVARRSGLTKIIAGFLSPITSFIFKGLKKTSYAMQLITMNITANLLGLGNASTPLGIAAMTELEKELPASQKGTASDNMIILAVINTASIQVIPTTVATLRLKYGAINPLDCLTAILISSLLSATVAITTAKLLNRLFPAREGEGTKGGEMPLQVRRFPPAAKRKSPLNGVWGKAPKGGEDVI